MHNSQFNPQHLNFEKLEEHSWDTLAHIALTFQHEFEIDDKETRKAVKEISFIKHIIHENLKSEEYAERFINSSLFVGLVRSIDKIEKLYEKKGVRNKAFLLFLKVLLNKIKKEKIKVHKPIERKVEFKKMKDVVENGFDSVLQAAKNGNNGKQP